MQTLSLSAMVALLLCAVPVVAIQALPRPVDGPVLVLGAPGSLDGILARAGGHRVGPRAAPLAVLATDNGGDPARYAARLKRAGAWAVVDGRALSLLCGVGP